MSFCVTISFNLLSSHLISSHFLISFDTKLAWTADETDQDTGKGKQVQFITADIQRQVPRASMIEGEMALQDADLFARQLLGGVRLKQNIHFSGDNEHATTATLNASDRQHWLFHMNTAAALSTVVTNVHTLLHSKSVMGRWTNVKYLVREKAKAGLRKVQEDIRKQKEDVNEDRKRRNEVGFQKTPFDEEEQSVLDLTIDPSCDFAGVLERIMVAQVDPLVQDLVRDVLELESMKLNELTTEHLPIRMFVVLLKLEYLQLKEHQYQAYRDIETATRKINQLELAKLTARNLQRNDDRQNHADEMNPLHAASDADLRLDHDFDQIVVDPGATMRRGMTTKMIKKRDRRASILSTFKETTAAPQYNKTLTTPLSSVPEKDSSDLKSESSGSKEYPDPEEATNDAMISDLLAGNKQEPSMLASLMQSIKNPQVYRMQQEIKVCEKNMEWLRIEHEKWKVYTGVLGRCILSMESMLYEDDEEDMYDEEDAE